MFGLPFRRNDHIGRLLYVENVPASNVRGTTKRFKDANFKEGFALVVIIGVLFFGCIQNQLQT
jgi:hypothetical protein